MQLTEHENRVGFSKLGRLSNEIINLLDLSINEQDIIFWYNRITHIRKQQLEFKDEREFADFINHIPEVVNHPDYVVLHPDLMSIKFIKHFECNMVVELGYQFRADYMFGQRSRLHRISWRVTY